MELWWDREDKKLKIWASQGGLVEVGEATGPNRPSSFKIPTDLLRHEAVKTSTPQSTITAWGSHLYVCVQVSPGMRRPWTSTWRTPESTSQEPRWSLQASGGARREPTWSPTWRRPRLSEEKKEWEEDEEEHTKHRHTQLFTHRSQLLFHWLVCLFVFEFPYLLSLETPGNCCCLLGLFNCCCCFAQELCT